MRQGRRTPVRAGSGGAFSLTEVVIALGIISFALVAGLGLLGVGLHASRQSSEDTALAAMTTQVLSQVSQVSQTGASAAATAVFFFNADGILVTNASGAAYRAVSSRTSLPAGEIPNLSTNFQKISVVFTWPASAPVPAHTNTVHASLLLP